MTAEDIAELENLDDVIHTIFEMDDQNAPLFDDGMDTSTHYVDREEFTREMHEYSLLCKEARLAGLPKPNITESIGRKFIAIAENYGNLHSFRKYTYLDEMIGDAIENMTRYAHNFDIELVGKSGAFSYFTKFTYWAFLRRLAKEDLQYRTKVKWVQSFALHDMLPDTRQEHDNSENFENKFVEYLYEYYDAEHKKEIKKPPEAEVVIEKPRPPTALEKAMAKQIDTHPETV